jgi:hypothetical protein
LCVVRETTNPEQAIVFVHDDVHLLDFFGWITSRWAGRRLILSV